MKLIAFSGAHGTGKTTLVEGLSDTYQRRSSTAARTVQSTMYDGHTLSEITNTPEKSRRFQDQVMAQFSLELDTWRTNAEAAQVSVTDRHIADLYAYAALWCQDDKASQTWLQDYDRRCSKLLEYFDYVFWVPIRSFLFQAEAARADAATRLRHQNLILEFFNRHRVRYHMLSPVSVEDRLAYCRHHIGRLL